MAFLKELVVCSTLMLGLAGCAVPRLYDSERDRQGQAARKAWSEVDLQAMIDGERANLNKLLAAEIDTQQKLAAAIRDHELRSMVLSPSLSAGLAQRIEQRLNELTGGKELSAELQQKLHASQLLVAEEKNIFTRVGLAQPDCARIANGATPQYIDDWLRTKNVRVQAAINSSLKVLREECAKNLSEASLYEGLGGAIGKAWAEYRNQATELESHKRGFERLNDDYVLARTQYEQAVAAGAAGPLLSPQIKLAATKLNDAVDALRNSSNPYAARLLAEQSLQEIVALAQAIAEAQPGEPLPAGASPAAAVFIVLPELIDRANSRFAEARKPLVLPLLIRKNHEQLNLEAVKRDIAAREQIVSLSHELVATQYRQAKQLTLARAALEQPTVKPLQKLSFMDAFGTSGVREREALYGAAARYLDAVNRLDAQRYTLEYKRVAAYHEKSLAYAEVNAKQWESLINTSVSQVADYAASGLKPDQVANFANTLGLLYIGAGVNK